MDIRRLIITAALLSTMLIPAAAIASKNTYSDPFSPASLCRQYGLSGKHAKHQKSPYAKCVSGLRTMQHHKKYKATTACRNQSRKHRKHKLSPYGRCLKAAHALRHK